MYTKNAHHDWIPLANRVGTPSYVYIKVYRQIGGRLFSSMSCQRLACSSFLQIPRTHILFSLASYSEIQRQDVPETSHPLTLVTLSEASLALFEAFHSRRNALNLSIKELDKRAKSKKMEDRPLHATVSSGSGESSSEEDS